MAEILGLGITHYPRFSKKGNFARLTKNVLNDPLLPAHLRVPDNWHPTMRQQWGSDEGLAHSEMLRKQMIDHFRKVRAELDAFQPDFVLIWGDDQYENYQEDCVPAFSVLSYDSIETYPWKHAGGNENWWGEPEDKAFVVRGHRKGGKYIASALLAEGIDVAYGYKPLHHTLGHAFLNSILYLDFDRRGFPFPVVPFTVNAYGQWLTGTRGVPVPPSEVAQLDEDRLDPPAPQPWRCFQVGAAVARCVARSPWRVALIASSSWSHSFLVPKHSLLYPDVEADKRYFEALCNGDWSLWRNTTIEEAVDRGHHELLMWFCLAGAMAELGRKPDEAHFLESWISNSDKVFAIFRPQSADATTRGASS